jgi:hypothetical protein
MALLPGDNRGTDLLMTLANIWQGGTVVEFTTGEKRRRGR